jgi:hypothetical protein
MTKLFGDLGPPLEFLSNGVPRTMANQIWTRQTHSDLTRSPHHRMHPLLEAHQTSFGVLLLGLMLAVFLSISNQAVAQTTPDFGPNVYIVDPGMSSATINATLATLAGYGQFDTRRAAVLFQPGTYTGIESEVGYYESITGLGETPSAVNLSQSFLESNGLIDGNDTQTFWRSMENL